MTTTRAWICDRCGMFSTEFPDLYDEGKRHLSPGRAECRGPSVEVYVCPVSAAYHQWPDPGHMPYEIVIPAPEEEK
jgi:hypothetical protein